MRRYFRIALFSLVTASTAIASNARSQSVPDQASAIQVAEKVLI